MPPGTAVHEGRLQDFVLQQMTEETPAPVSVSPTGATETDVARRPESHAQRGFRAVPQRVKTRETTPLTSD